jgi:uncharacterized protein (DUF1810 family)
MTELDRFVSAQARVWPRVVAELEAGAKVSHWMWFVFPQLRGLGRSETARVYGIADLEEARAYLAHPVLGPRLEEAVGLMLRHRGRPAEAVLGPVDGMKLRSCLTLFEAADPERGVFAEALEAFYGSERCAPTLRMLAG